MPTSKLKTLLLLCGLASGLFAKPTDTLTIGGDPVVDPDDLCFVVLQPANDVFLIASDKKANAVFLVNDRGQVLDKVPVAQPGNIDSRQAFPIGRDSAQASWQNGISARSPLIVVNGRQKQELVALAVVATPNGPKLRRLPSEMPTGENYGGCLYRNKDRFYFFSTTKGGLVQQFEITNNGNKLVSRRVRAWKSPICEGAVADDQNGVVFLCEEQVGIRKLQAAPANRNASSSNDSLETRSDEELIVKIGDHDISGDLEGITILPTGEKTGYLVASDQGRSQFVVLDRQAPHRLVGKFSIDGVQSTDGVDVFTSAFGPRFRSGVIACHTDTDDGCKIIVSPLQKVFAFPLAK